MMVARVGNSIILEKSNKPQTLPVALCIDGVFYPLKDYSSEEEKQYFDALNVFLSDKKNTLYDLFSNSSSL